MKDNPFLNIHHSEKIFESLYFFAIWDKYPVNPGHVLIISERHAMDFFDLLMKEQIELGMIIPEVVDIIRKKYHFDGINIGMNCGDIAGQTVPHFHCHIIPRYTNDVENPVGGVRNVIPSRADYLTNI